MPFAQPRRSVRQSVCRCFARPAVRQSRRPLPSRRADPRRSTLGLAQMDLLPPRLQGTASRRLGQGATPSCSSSMSRRRWRPVTGPASSAGAPMRGLSRRRSLAGLLCPRTRSIACCTHNGSTGGPSAGTGARSTACPTAALSPWSTSLAAPGPSAALRCCNGHPADTPRRMRVRAILWLTFSHRPAPWLRWRATIDHAGTRARMRGRSSAKDRSRSHAARWESVRAESRSTGCLHRVLHQPATLSTQRRAGPRTGTRGARAAID